MSSDGQVRSVARLVGSRWATYQRPVRQSVLWQRLNQRDYLWVRLSREGRAYSKVVHRLVLEAFVGPCPPGMEGCHNDGHKQNNRLGNLRWDTPRENQLDTVRAGTHHMTARTHCKHGHPFDEKNTRINKRTGARVCRACWARIMRANRANRANRVTY